MVMKIKWVGRANKVAGGSNSQPHRQLNPICRPSNEAVGNLWASRLFLARASVYAIARLSVCPSVTLVTGGSVKNGWR